MWLRLSSKGKMMRGEVKPAQEVMAKREDLAIQVVILIANERTLNS